MSWSSLGTVAPRLDQWTLFDGDDINGRLFRITQDDSIYVPRGFAWLSFLYLINEQPSYHRFHKIYPDWKNPGAKLIISPIPKEFLSAGIGVRIPAAKLHYRSIWTEPTWKLSLEVWLGALEGDTELDLLAEVNSKLDILITQ